MSRNEREQNERFFSLAGHVFLTVATLGSAFYLNSFDPEKNFSIQICQAVCGMSSIAAGVKTWNAFWDNIPANKQSERSASPSPSRNG